MSATPKGCSINSTRIGEGEFRTTHWTVVLAASAANTPGAEAAMAQLCKVYWRPLYVFVRRLGHGTHDGEDLVQAFFAKILEKHYLSGITREGGKFRSYLLKMLKHFLANEWDRAQTQKRGGGNSFLSLDSEAGRGHEQDLAGSCESPLDLIFDREWALTLLEHVMKRLQEEYRFDKKGALFERLQFSLSGSKADVSYQELGGSLGLSESAVKVSIHRLRKRYGELLREQISQTVATPEEVQEEIRYLISIVATPV